MADIILTGKAFEEYLYWQIDLRGWAMK